MRRKTVFLLSLLMLAGSACSFTPGIDGELIQKTSLVGDSVTLPCDASTSNPGDSLMVLVWYKNNNPVYSFDARVQKEWSEERLSKNTRMGFKYASGRSALKIENLTEADEGIYHCRVDFIISPTRNSGVNLTVIILPSKPFFLNEVDNKVENRTHAYHEGDSLIISCLVIGGRPPPQIYWYEGDSLLDATDGPSEIPNVRENELYLPLTRERGNRNFTCLATNNNITRPLESSVYVELYVPPSSVKITGLDGEVIADVPMVLRCDAVGSHPPPTISWWVDHQQIFENFNQTWFESNSTLISYLKFTPKRTDVKRVLSCVATNEVMAPNKGTVLQTIDLNVLFSPSVEVLNLSEDNTRTIEGSTLQLKCEVEANPPALAVRWYFNDSKILSSGLFGNIAQEDHQLIISNITRHQTGRYSCEAANFKGTTRSRDINISVLFAPECQTSTPNTSVTLKGKQLMCHIKSLPKSDIFLWHVEVKGQVQKVTTAREVLDLNVLRPPLDGDLKVTCEADNGVGKQLSPCAGTVNTDHLRPPMPQNCDIQYLDEENAYLVGCDEVKNATHYTLSIWSTSSRNSSLALSWRARSSVPRWRTSLDAGDEAEIKACGTSGCGQPARLRRIPIVEAARWWQGIMDKEVGVPIGIALLVIVFIVSTLLITRMVTRFTKQKPPVIQVVQLEEIVAREYLQSIERKCCSDKSCPSIYSYNSQEDSAPSIDRSVKPRTFYWDTLPPPDVTSHTIKESTV